MKKKIIFTGGGSGGHVIPAMTLISRLKNNHDIYYVGSRNGIEKELALKKNIDYTSITTGKLRRYLSFENLFDFFKVLIGTLEAFLFLWQFKKNETVIVATGGFVIVPVVIAAFLQRKKIIIHEQTSRVGLANKIAGLVANKVLVTFKDSLRFFPAHKVVHAGYPLREEIFQESEGLSDALKPNEGRPLLFITGGGNGSYLLNTVVEEVRSKLLKDFFIVHQVGKNHFEAFRNYETNHYRVFSFVGHEMIDLMKEASVIISRSGAGTVVELMALGKPSIFIPLKIAQKNEQYHNAKQAEKILGSIVLEEKDLSGESLLDAVNSVQSIPLGVKATHNPTDIIIRHILENV